MQTIDLAKPRIIVIEDRGRQYSLTVKPISRADWLTYFEGVVSTSETLDGKRIDSIDASGARLDLLEKNLIDLRGYSVGELPKDWHKTLPLSHRLAAANTLVNVGPSASERQDDAPLALGAETVYLDAVWSADEADVMHRLQNLRHDFKTPTAEHQRRYSRDASRSRVVGGSRSGKTQWMGASATLAALYDELIVSVEGYSWSAETLADAEQIVARMDTYHKVSAAGALFSPAVPKFGEEG